VDRALQTLGDVSALVNNAGVYGPVGRLDETSWTEWVDAVQINLFGTILMCRAVLPHFRTRGSGKIVNLSGGGATAPLPRFSAYAASKAAVVRITETLAEEFKAERIDVNAIAPGALNTRLLDQVLDAGPEKAGAQFHQQALKQRDSGGVPLEKGAALAVFLASAASDGITGRLLSAVWDDWAHLPEHRTELAGSDVFTLRRIVPKDRGLEWSRGRGSRSSAAGSSGTSAPTLSATRTWWRSPTSTVPRRRRWRAGSRAASRPTAGRRSSSATTSTS
jgi:3-oxoacyl-[acyl-carrier protein] reductase